MLLSNSVDSTTETASEDYNGDDDAATVAERKAKGVWLALAAYLVGTFITGANVMVIRAVLTTEALQTRANMYVVSLASSDALVGAMQWAVGTQYLPSATAWFDNTAPACVGLLSLTYVATIGSAFNISLTALDRYFYITRPFQYERLASERRVLIAIGCAWLAALGIGGSPVVFNTFPTARVCTLEQVIPTVFRSYVCVAIFVVCCSVTFVAYAKIGWLSYRTLKTIAQARASFGGFIIVVQTQSSGTGPQEPSAASPRSLAAAANPRRPARGSLKALKLFVVMFGFLVVCWSPYFTVEVVNIFRKVDKAVYQVCMILGFFNSGVNALAYPLFNKDFRRALKKMLCRDRCRCARRGCRRGRVADAGLLPSAVLGMTVSSSLSSQRPSQSLRDSKTMQ